MEIVQDSYIIPSTGPLREQLAEMRQEREEREAELAQRSRQGSSQPTLAEVMALLQKLMAEVLLLRSASQPEPKTSRRLG